MLLPLSPNLNKQWVNENSRCHVTSVNPSPRGEAPATATALEARWAAVQRDVCPRMAAGIQTPEEDVPQWTRKRWWAALPLWRSMLLCYRKWMQQQLNNYAVYEQLISQNWCVNQFRSCFMYNVLLSSCVRVHGPHVSHALHDCPSVRLSVLLKKSAWNHKLVRKLPVSRGWTVLRSRWKVNVTVAEWLAHSCQTKIRRKFRTEGRTYWKLSRISITWIP